ncbi:hypothetical protein [Xanthobacter tagetidis]|uniref:STAS/SEC14 domain-containing protein n=1 Tax=Xanthobacter tagetidis TaxID=60216 RepID=A0A3L7AEE2_9HYPH|nr:hypothetical protein [Xanthobacter tagetidis]MBB6305819.1 hypothetical protein [Xanthobacter tagetidis]RLP78344.1 hypothetical protein D9R14_11070 [Xanthobacter tagetidis]
MVRLDEEPGSLLVLRFHQPYGAGDEEAYLASLDAIAAHEGPFRLMTVFGGGPALSRAGERSQALWFKATRARIDGLCRACAIVRPNAGEEMAQVFRRLWSFPLIATPDEAEARAFLARHAGSPS